MRDVAMGPMEIRGTSLRRFPVRRRERGQVVAGCHLRQAGEHVAQVGEWILPVPLARDDDRVDDGGALAGVGMADEEPVLFSNRRRADGIFNQVVVQPRLTMLQMRGERRPVPQQVT